MTLFGQGVILAVVGMGVVFGSLIGLMYVIKALDAVFRPKEEEGPAQESPAGAAGANGAGAAGGSGAGGESLHTVLAAAVAHFLATERPALFTVPVRRGGESEWSRRARCGAARPALARRMR
ncbi:MAG: OadG family protein [bacterium]